MFSLVSLALSLETILFSRESVEEVVRKVAGGGLNKTKLFLLSKQATPWTNSKYVLVQRFVR